MTPTRRASLLLTLAVLATSSGSAAAQTPYTWTDTTPNWTLPSAWSPTGPIWTQHDRLTDAVAVFGNRGSIVNPPTIGSNTLFANGVTIDNTGAEWNIGGTTGVLNLGSGGLTLTGFGTTTITANVHLATNQTWNVGTGGTLNMGGASNAGVLSGVATLTKTGGGTLVIDNQYNVFAGTIALSAGTLQVSSLTNDARITGIRNAAIDFGNGTGRLTGGVGFAGGLQVGQWSGTNPGASVVFDGASMLALTTTTFSGSVTGNLTISGPGNQTLNGNTTGLGSIRIDHGATLTLAGTGDSTSGVTPNTNYTIFGGSLVLDNRNGNTSAAGGRLLDTAQVTLQVSGRFAMLGSPDGSSESIGALSIGGVNSVINVTHNSSSASTTLTFSSLSLGSNNYTSVNFTNTGGTLGASGNNPRILFSTSPNVDATGLIAPGGNVGRAIVNGRSFARYDATSGVQAMPDASLTAFGTFSTTTNALLTGGGNTGGSGSLNSLNTLTLDPSGANQSLDINGTGNLSVSSILYRGKRTDYTIGSSGGGTLTGPGDRTIWVADPNGVLTVTAQLGAGSLTQAGAGTLALNNSNNSSSASETTIAGGVLRLSSAGSLPSGTLTVRAAVLEIGYGSDGLGAAADFTRSIGSGGVTYVSNGGFSAINSNASVSLNGSGGLNWDGFLPSNAVMLFGSINANARITLQNDIALDTGTAGGYTTRIINVFDNPNSTADYARLSGKLTGTISTDLIKAGPGTLELTGPNTYQGNTLVQNGTLVVGNGGSIGTAIFQTGNVVVYKGATLAGVGTINGNPTATVLVNPGAAIRGGSTVVAADRLGTLTINSNLTLQSSTDNAILRVEASRTGPGTADASLIALGSGYVLDLNPGPGKFTIDLENGVNGLQSGEFYTLTLATVGSAGNILLNGTSLTHTSTIAGQVNNGVIDPSLYTLQSSSFASFSNVSLLIGSDDKSLMVSFSASAAPVPEPSAVLGIAAVLILGGLLRRRQRQPGEPTSAV